MSVESKFETILSECPVVAILRGAGPDEILEIAEAVVRGGVRLIEVTMNSPSALKSVARLVERFADGGALVGAGTVLSVEEVAKLADVGAGYVISPNVNADVIRETKRLGLLSLPGFMTPTEAFAALDAGADYLKFFPALQGPSHIKALKAVVPAPILAVGGVDLSNAAEFLSVADGLGIGSGIYKKGKSPEEVERNAAKFAAVASERCRSGGVRSNR